MPRFSVVVPVFDPPIERLRSCLRSIENQTFKDFELILVDDGSTGSIRELLVETCADSSRYVLVRQNNRGASAARNLGTQSSRGDYLCYLDADDELPPYVLARAAEILEDNPVDILLGYTQYFLPGEEKSFFDRGAIECGGEGFVDALYNYHLSGSSSLFEESGRGKIGVKVGPVARFLRSDLARKCDFPLDVRVGEDTLWALKTFNYAQSAAVCRDTWYWYCVAHPSLTRGYQCSASDNAERFFSLLIKEIEERHPTVNPSKVLARVLGEVNRVVRCELVYPECSLSLFQKIGRIRSLLSLPSVASFSTWGNALKGGPALTAKYLICKTGLVLLYWGAKRP